LACAIVLIALASWAAVTRADLVSGDQVLIRFHGSIRPKIPPRHGTAPVALHVQGTVKPLNGEEPAGLARFTVQVNRHAAFTPRGLPICAPPQLRGTNTQAAPFSSPAASAAPGAHARPDLRPEPSVPSHSASAGLVHLSIRHRRETSMPAYIRPAEVSAGVTQGEEI
jgi:hypothetical protein